MALLSWRVNSAPSDEWVRVAREFSIVIADVPSTESRTSLRPWAEEFSVTVGVSGKGDVAQALVSAAGELGREVLDTAVLSDWDAMTESERAAAVQALDVHLDSGLVMESGVASSLESGLAEAEAAFARAGVPLAVVQVPANLINQSLDHSRVLSDLYARGTRIQVTDVFASGKLFDPSESHPAVTACSAHAAATGMTVIEAALAHVKSLPWASEVVLDAPSPDDLRAMAQAWERVRPTRAPVALHCDDPALPSDY